MQQGTDNCPNHLEAHQQRLSYVRKVVYKWNIRMLNNVSYLLPLFATRTFTHVGTPLGIW